MQKRLNFFNSTLPSFVLAAILFASCAKNPVPVEPDPPPPLPKSSQEPEAASAPNVQSLTETLESLNPAIKDSEGFESKSLEELNRESPLEAAFFSYDSATLNSSARKVLEANAEFLKQHPTWVITIEGHCDERGTPEYNLGLGERRSAAVRDYLIELGLILIRLRTVSYGKEFPFSPEKNEAAWAMNRRAHFVITEK